MSSLTLPIPNAHFIWFCAWSSLFSAIFAYSRPTTAHFAIVPANVFATSLLYWRNPVRNSWRRVLDIAVVLSGLTYQSYYAYAGRTASGLGLSYSCQQIYACLIGLSASCYGLSTYFMKRQRIWAATYPYFSQYCKCGFVRRVQ